MSGRDSSPSWSKSMPTALWPAADRAAWEAAHNPGDVLEPGGVASRWSFATRRKTALGYGRFLFFLHERGELDPMAVPAHRINRDRLATYLAELQRTNRGHTIQNRIQELGDAMRALAPDGDWRWILRAAGRLRASTIPSQNKRARLRPIEELIADGLRLMDEAENNPRLSALGRALDYRDGLIVAFLGFHPMRLRNLAGLEIGRHIVERDEQFFLCLSASETKGGQPYEPALAAPLTERLGRYLHQHRPVLLSRRGRWYAAPGNALWISKHGSRCSEDTFENVIRKRTGGNGGAPLSPHLFRNCAATSVAVRAPGSVYIIPAVLGHGSPRTGERYYNLASSLEASRAHAAMLEELRRDLLRQPRRYPSKPSRRRGERRREPPQGEEPPCAP